jgi:hypothetical protein
VAIGGAAGEQPVADAHGDHAIVMTPFKCALDVNAASQNDCYKHGDYPQILPQDHHTGKQAIFLF